MAAAELAHGPVDLTDLVIAAAPLADCRRPVLETCRECGDRLDEHVPSLLGLLRCSVCFRACGGGRA